MRILVENYTPRYCSVTVEHTPNVAGAAPIKFKVWYENDNSYNRGAIEIQTKNLDYAKVYTDSDIPGCTFDGSYVSNKDVRVNSGKRCIKIMLDFIETVY